jgi:hypothetical protein
VAQFGGAARRALAGGGCCCARPRTGPSHCARVWAGGWRPRLRGTENQRQAPPAGALQTLRDPNTPRRRRSELWSPSPGSLVADGAVNGTILASRHQVGPLLLWWRFVRLDAGCPGWLAEPADSDEETGTTPPVGSSPRTSRTSPHRRVCVCQWTGSTPRAGVVSWVPRRVGGRSQADRTAGVRPDETRPQQRVMRLDTGWPVCFRKATTRRGTQDTRRPQAATATRQHNPAPYETKEAEPSRAATDPPDARGPPRCRAPAGGTCP